MANRDYEDRNEGRFEGRERDDFRDQSNRGSRDWDRRGDDFRETRGYYGQGRDDQASRRDDWQSRQYGAGGYGGSRYGQSERGFAEYGQYGQRPEQTRDWEGRGQGYEGRREGHRWFEERQEAQRFDRERDRSSSFGSPTGAAYGQYGRDWGHSASYGSPSYDYRRPDYTRTQSNYGARESFDTQPYTHTDYGRAGSEWTDRDARSEYGREARGRDDENWGDQFRHGMQHMANRVKRAFRGPKGYKRSDERIREDVSDRLAQQDELDPSDIEVTVANGEVTLAGTVQSRREKFLAEEISDEVSGVNDVHNQLRVRRADMRENAPASTTSATATGEAPRNRNTPRA